MPVPSTTTCAPATGAPFADSVTVPTMRPLSCAAAEAPNAKVETRATRMALSSMDAPNSDTIRMSLPRNVFDPDERRIKLRLYMHR